jgi:hypothetical protein
MANYVLVYKGGSSGMQQDPAEQKKIMDAWTGWFGQLGAAVVDGGNPFGPSASIGPDKNVKDGASSGLTGYSVLKADSLQAATEMAKGCPHLAAGGTVEVYETFAVM